MPRTISRTPKDRDHPFVQVDQRIVEDAALSWKARGLLAYILSKPDDWQVRVTDLVRRGIEGESSVRSGLRELETCGYLCRRRMRDPTTGRFAGFVYTVSERPTTADTPVAKQTHSVTSDAPDPVQPDAAVPDRVAPGAGEPDVVGPPPTHIHGTQMDLTHEADSDPPHCPPTPAGTRSPPASGPPTDEVLKAVVEPTTDHVLSEVVGIFEQEIPGTLTAMTFDDLTDLVTNECRDLDTWRAAFRASIGAHNRWKYTKAVILNAGKHPPQEKTRETRSRNRTGPHRRPGPPQGARGRPFSKPGPDELARIEREALSSLAVQDPPD